MFYLFSFTVLYFTSLPNVVLEHRKAILLQYYGLWEANLMSTVARNIE